MEIIYKTSKINNSLDLTSLPLLYDEMNSQLHTLLTYDSSIQLEYGLEKDITTEIFKVSDVFLEKENYGW